MATSTPNFNLVKPDLNDFADIRVLNGNMDIIDAQLKKAGDINLSDYATKTELKNYLPLTGGNVTGDITIKNNEVDYIIEHSTDGRSYYNKYNSGKLVQVIYKDRTTITSGITGETLTFLTPFINESYLAWVGYEINVKNRYGWQNTALSPTVGGAGSNGTTEPRWEGRTATSLTVTVDSLTDVYVLLVGRWKE